MTWLLTEGQNILRFVHSFFIFYKLIKKGVALKASKLASVKRMLVLAAVPEVPENYQNVKVLPYYVFAYN